MVFIFQFVVGAADAPPGMTLVPASKHDGLRIAVSGTHTLSAPSAEWQWYSLAPRVGAAGFTCMKGETGIGFGVIYMKNKVAVNVDTVKLFVEGSKGEAKSRGMVVSNGELKESPIPIAGKSFRYSYTLKNQNGTARHVQYLILEDTSMLCVQAELDGDVESAEFTAFVKSLKAWR